MNRDLKMVTSRLKDLKMITGKLDELVKNSIVAEWRWGTNDVLLIFVNDSMWTAFKESAKDLLLFDDEGVHAFIMDNYICIEADIDEDFNI